MNEIQHPQIARYGTEIKMKNENGNAADYNEFQEYLLQQQIQQQDYINYTNSKK